jgi:aminoglycoside phosphotransferase (APT) family kinase protein
MDMHPGQLTVGVDTVRALVDRQFSAWRDLPIREVRSHGTVNALFRVGDTLVARFPLVLGEVGATRHWLETEARAARELLGRTRFPTPEPVGLGEPGSRYPLPWSVQTWLPGHRRHGRGPGCVAGVRHDLAEFIRDVRAIETCGRTFRGLGRGGHLPDHDSWMQTCFERSEQLLEVAPLRRLWAELRELPAARAGT